EALTLRWFGSSLPPDEDWVTLTCTSEDGTRIETRHDWQVVTRDDLRTLLASGRMDSEPTLATLGIDLKTELLRRVRKALFDAPALRADAEMAVQWASGRTPQPPRADISMLPDVYPRFGSVQTPSGVFGYIRLATFAPRNGDVDLAVNEFVRL